MRVNTPYLAGRSPTVYPRNHAVCYGLLHKTL